MASWWLSFHGDTGITNLQTFTTAGTLDNSALLQPPPSASGWTLDELRGFVFDTDGNLYVANASGSNSAILCYSPSAGSQLSFTGAFASDNITHPFDLALAFSSCLFVSNQTHSGAGGNNVTYYQGFPYSTTGSYAGTFAGGFTDVRGLAFDGTYLYVADAGGNTVTPYDSAGTAQAPIVISQPDHLYFDRQRYLYIASENSGGSDDCSIYLYDTTTPGSKPMPFLSNADPGFKSVSGFWFGGDGYLYVANRTANEIERYAVTPGTPPICSSTGSTFMTSSVLQDNPEFIQLVS